MIQPRQHPGDELRTVERFDLVHNEAALAHHPPLAHEEQLDGRLELIVADADDVEVLVPGPGKLLLLDRTPHASQAVPQPRSELELQFRRCLSHALFEIIDNVLGVPLEETDQIPHKPVVGVCVDLADAGSSALLDVVQQARPAEPLMGLQLAVAAGADRERPQQQVERLPDGICVAVRAEVPIPALAPTPNHHCSGPLVKEGDREERVRLVVSQPYVEPRLMPLDEAVLQHERLDLGGDLDPLNGRSRGDHLGGAWMPPGGIAEVAVQPGAQALGLADVDDAAVRVQELVTPRRIWYRSPRWTQTHTGRLWSRAGRCARVGGSRTLCSRDPAGRNVAESPAASNAMASVPTGSSPKRLSPIGGYGEAV